MKKMLAMLRLLGMLAVLFGSGFALTGCEADDNGIEDAAEEVEETTEDAGDEIEDAVD